MTHRYSQEDIKIALFEPDIPQNTAAIIRTCACLGVKLEIIGPCGFLLTDKRFKSCLLYTSPSPRDGLLSRMPSSA